MPIGAADMVIRRIREHIDELNWFAVAIDFLIVVAGIVIGTQVNNWNEKRIEAEQARSYRARLINELEFNARQFIQQIAYYRQVRAYGLQALAELTGEQPVDDRDFLIASYQLSQVDTTAAKTNIYDEMTANGLVDRLGSDDLQQQASDYYLGLSISNRQLQDNQPYRNVIRQVMPYDLQRRIRDDCGDRAVFHQDRLVGVKLVVPCPVTLDPAAVATGARIVRGTPDMVGLMTRYLASIDEKIDNLRPGRGSSLAFRRRLIDAGRH